jgi:hypothetical protein
MMKSVFPCKATTHQTYLHGQRLHARGINVLNVYLWKGGQIKHLIFSLWNIDVQEAGDQKVAYCGAALIARSGALIPLGITERERLVSFWHIYDDALVG